MININLRDPYLVENVKAIQELKKSGIFTDEHLQEMYKNQVEHDTRLLDMREKCDKYVHTIAQEGPIDMCWDDFNDTNSCAFRFCPYLNKSDVTDEE